MWRPGIWVRVNEHRLPAPSSGQKSTLSIVGIKLSAQHATRFVGPPQYSITIYKYFLMVFYGITRGLYNNCIELNALLLLQLFAKQQ